MRIRTQLVIASFLLSILPLTAIVGYSYHTSREAVETAYQREAATLTRQMDTRLASIRTDLEQRLAEVSALPLRDMGESSRRALVGNVMMAMGDAASLVDSLEIHPFPHPVHVQVAQASPRAAPRAAPVPPPAPPDASDADPDPDPQFDEAFVIDVPDPPATPRFSWTDEERAQLKEITRLSVQLGQNWKSMTPEQREELQKQLKTVQVAFDANMKRTSAEFQKQLEAARKGRADARRVRRQERGAEKTEETRVEALEDAQEAAQDRAEIAADAADAAAEVQAAAKVESAPAVAPVPKVAVVKKITPEEKERLKVRQKQATLLFGHRLNVPMRREGEVIGRVSAQVSTEEVIKRVLGGAADRDEIAFAVDRDGNVYTRTADDKKTLETIGLLKRLKETLRVDDIPNWVVAFNFDPQSGLRIGVARPVGDTFDALRKTAAKNFGYGMGLVFIALIGIVPIANHITRDVKLVSAGADRIAHGDLTTRLPVTSSNEFGQLAGAFNRMAQDLSVQQQTIIEQERARKDQEIQQRLLAVEYDRKSVELEEARRFQLSMLPKSVPSSDRYDVAVYTQTATEVGGDYYDFHVGANGLLSVTIGDATGHGAKAGTMVTVIKTLFSDYAGGGAPSAFLHDAAETIKRMDLGRMAMALVLARLEGTRMTVASAGMPPAYVHRAATGNVEEVAFAATPLGTLGADYSDLALDLEPGDTVLFMTDGFPELLNEGGQQLGYVAAQQEFTAAATAPDADGVIAALAAAAQRWHGDQPPNDDVTFVVVRVRA
ncbi:MAG: SpoIIE family protein phosphatase [Acidobacteriota bacterium]